MKQTLLSRFFKELKEKQKSSANAQAMDTSRVAKSGILGVVVGDIVGSTLEFADEKTTNFKFYTDVNQCTDDGWGIAAAYYGIPDKLAKKALDYLTEDMIEVIVRFEKMINVNE